MAVNMTTFFSYKGGAGRSTTCLNTLPYLANKCGASGDRPLLVLDMDIDSAGMTYLLEEQDHFSKAKDHDVKGFLSNKENLASGSANIKDSPFYKWFVPVGHKLGLDENDAVMFLGVNDNSDTNKNNTPISRAQAMNQLFNFAERYLVSQIVFDSAAGDQPSAEISIGNSDKIVFCMRPTRQFRIGTARYLAKLNGMNNRALRKKKVILLPTVIPKDSIIDGQSQIKQSIEEISKIFTNYENFILYRNFVENENEFGINEVTRFKWKESVLFKLRKEARKSGQTLADDELTALERYKKVAELIYD